ncbi:MAG: GNAT family N-acetyltransferase [Treponema sp.]|nr:GNAT family N-acetyltransferase [Treponema sp.]
MFLQPYESECVNLASEILRGSTDCWAVLYAEQSLSGNESQCGEASQTKTLAGLIALRKKRSLFFCLPFAKYKSAFDKKVCSEAQRPLMEFFESREPFCVNGEAAGAIFLRNILKNKKSPMRPSVTNKYFLMARDGGAENQKASQDLNAGGGSGLAKDLRVVQATAADYERLLPLELGYQREEVVPKSFDVSDAALAAAFKHELEQGLTFALFDGGRPIAKARLAASGQRYCMLGGVYTIPSERKKGRAAFLVSQIIARSQAHGVNNFCLYAKQENAAALALYKSLGFAPRGEYLLIYY